MKDGHEDGAPDFHDPDKLFPALCRLGLGVEELAALRGQGFVSRESRSGGRLVIYKLRFRYHGRQVTRYLGSDASAAREVAQELATLQAPTQRQRTLKRIVRAAWKVMRQGKAAVEPLLREKGLYFHGMSVRRRQRAR